MICYVNINININININMPARPVRLGRSGSGRSSPAGLATYINIYTGPAEPDRPSQTGRARPAEPALAGPAYVILIDITYHNIK